mgnify:CR=1 FL=1
MNGKCVVCGREPSAGYAKIGAGWYCHGDEDVRPTCYERSQGHRLAARLLTDHLRRSVLAVRRMEDGLPPF